LVPKVRACGEQVFYRRQISHISSPFGCSSQLFIHPSISATEDAETQPVFF